MDEGEAEKGEMEGEKREAGEIVEPEAKDKGEEPVKKGLGEGVEEEEESREGVGEGEEGEGEGEGERLSEAEKGAGFGLGLLGGVEKREGEDWEGENGAVGWAEGEGEKVKADPFSEKTLVGGGLEGDLEGDLEGEKEKVVWKGLVVVVEGLEGGGVESGEPNNDVVAKEREEEGGVLKGEAEAAEGLGED